jgi:hypothetical protein
MSAYEAIHEHIFQGQSVDDEHTEEVLSCSRRPHPMEESGGHGLTIPKFRKAPEV